MLNIISIPNQQINKLLNFHQLINLKTYEHKNSFPDSQFQIIAKKNVQPHRLDSNNR
jgi:predicted HAD superfamily Cof-like phosphohydrolase